MMRLLEFFRETKIIFLIFLLVLTGCVSQQQTQKDQENIRARARAHTDLGAAYYQQNKLDVALEEFSLAADIDPTFGFAFNGLGLVNAALKQDEVASQNFKKAIALEPTNSEAHNNYGNFLCARGRYNEAVDEYLLAVKNPLYSTPAAAYTNAGICSVRKKDTRNAEIYFGKALEIEPLSNLAAFQLASLQFQRNEAALAYKTIENLLVNNPSADVLLLAVKLANKINLKDAEKKYRMQLKELYPNSIQAKSLTGIE